MCLFAFTAVPAAPVNVSVTQLRAHSAMVTWNVPQGDTVIGYAISQQVQCLSVSSLLQNGLINEFCVAPYCDFEGKLGALPH